jgi:hypothetical protein
MSLLFIFISSSTKITDECSFPLNSLNKGRIGCAGERYADDWWSFSRYLENETVTVGERYADTPRAAPPTAVASRFFPWFLHPPESGRVALSDKPHK